MKRLFGITLLAVCATVTGPAFGETNVTLKDVHICCTSCVRAVEKVIAGVEGATVKVDRETQSVALTAANDAVAQKAVDALALAGFYGKSNNDKIAIKTVAAPNGKVQRLVVLGAHNCCNSCTVALKRVCGKVDGVTATEISPRTNSFVVEGSFEPNQLLGALRDAGFFARPKE